MSPMRRGSCCRSPRARYGILPATSGGRSPGVDLPPRVYETRIRGAAVSLVLLAHIRPELARALAAGAFVGITMRRCGRVLDRP